MPIGAMAMNIIFCGDRKWNNFQLIESVLLQYPKDTVIVEGDAWGADKITGFLCRKHGYVVKPEPAKWELYKKAAGPIRNREMIKKYSPIAEVIAFHNNINNSKGTKDMITAALEAGINVKLYAEGKEPLLITPKQKKLM
jgi:hypothetical protein